MKKSAKRMLTSKKGVTLVELVIAMAVTAIIAAMLVGMLISLSRIATRNSDLVEINTESYNIRVFFEAWFSQFDNDNSEFADSGDTIAAFYYTDDFGNKTKFTSFVSIDNPGEAGEVRTLTAEYPDGSSKTLRLKHSDEIYFVKNYTTLSGKCVYRVTVTYKQGDVTKEYNFVITSHAEAATIVSEPHN